MNQEHLFWFGVCVFIFFIIILLKIPHKAADFTRQIGYLWCCVCVCLCRCLTLQNDWAVHGNVNYLFHLTEADLFCCSTVLCLWKFVSVTELGREKLKFGVISKLQLKSSKGEVIFSVLYD